MEEEKKDESAQVEEKAEETIEAPPAPSTAWPETPEGKDYYKGIQRALNQKEAEIRQLQARVQEAQLARQDVQAIRVELEEAREAIANLQDLQGGTTEATERLRHQKEERSKVQVPKANPAVDVYGAEISYIFKKGGLNPATAPATCMADPEFSRLWNEGSYLEARDRAQQIVAEAQKPSQDVEAKAKELAEKMVKEMKDKSGMRNLDTGPGSGSKHWTIAQIRELQKTPEGLKEFTKHEREIMEAMNRGEIK